MKIDAPDCQDFDRALSLEWLETNGRGGFASGTVAGAHTRRYHALLLVARRPPSERFAFVNHLEEWIDIDEQTCSLSTNLYPNAVFPQGYRHCIGFTTVPWPTWSYEFRGKTVRRDVFCVRDRDLVVIRWTFTGGPEEFATLRVRPKLTGRDYHAMHHENSSLMSDAEARGRIVIWHPYADLPPVRALHNGHYRHAPEWYRCVRFELERLRGLDFEEDWWSPGEFIHRLASGETATLVLTTESIEKADVEAFARCERRRRAGLRKTAPRADPLAGLLWQAADDYLSVRGSRQTVIAGYPWFADWGRDTFISLPGLCLVTGRYEAAWQIIESYCAHVSDGMIPNRFPDMGDQPEYNAIDASLWFIHAVDRYLAYSRDQTRVRSVAWPVIKQIIDGYRQGTRYGIHMDVDGLVAGGVPGTQLTWMDAKVGDWVVTPRHGKPVEIQALWVRALEIGARLAEQFGDEPVAARCHADRTRARGSFQSKFWYEAGGFFYDVIDGPDGPDESIRPNQIYVLALCDDLATNDQGRNVLQLIRDQLLTPVGLRSLSPADSRYRAHYEGGVAERDRAYHQGTVWPFLLGPFVTAWLKVFGKSKETTAQARSFLEGLGLHLSEGCLGHVSEIFDAEAPHNPRGCPAQAWSVAEPLRAMIEDLGITAETSTASAKRIVLRRSPGPGLAPTQRRKKTAS